MPLPLLLLAPLAKAAFAKFLVAGVAHAAPATLTHAGMIAAGNVTASAAATGTVTGVVGVVGHAGHAAYKLSRKVERYRKKHGIDSNGKKIPFAPPDEETMMALIFVMMRQYYKNQIHYDYNGDLKDMLEQIDTCNDCSCTDYDDIEQANASDSASAHRCYCGHDWHRHSKQEEVEWLFKKFAAEYYEDINNLEHDGTTKEEPSQIDKCDKCECPDFDRKSVSENKVCRCGHGWGAHTKSPEKWHWIIDVMALVFAKQMQEEESSSSDSDDDDDEDDDGDNDDADDVRYDDDNVPDSYSDYDY